MDTPPVPADRRAAVAISAKLAAEHEELEYHLHFLERLLEADDAFASKRWAEDLRAWFRLVGPRMKDHFEHEESSHLYRAFLDEFPQHAGAVEFLRLQHRSMSLDLARLESRALGMPSPELTHDLKNIISTLRRHDAKERELIQRAYFDDVGGID